MRELLSKLNVDAIKAEIATIKTSFELLQLYKYIPQNANDIDGLRQALNHRHNVLGIDESLLSDEQVQFEICEEELLKLQILDPKAILTTENYHKVKSLTNFIELQILSNTADENTSEVDSKWSALQRGLKKLLKEKLFDDNTDAVKDIIPKGNEDYVFRRTNIRKVLRECEKHTDIVYRDVEKLLSAVIDFRSYFVPEGVFANLRRLTKSKSADQQNIASINKAFNQAEVMLNSNLLTDQQSQVLTSALQFALTSIQRRLEHIKEKNELLSVFQQALETRQQKLDDSSYTNYAAIPEKMPEPAPMEQAADVAESDEAIIQSAKNALEGKEYLLKEVKQLGEGSFGKAYLFEYSPDAENRCPLLDKMCVEQVDEDGNKHSYVVLKKSKATHLGGSKAFEKEAVIGHHLSNENGSLLGNAAYNLTYPAYYNGELVILSRYAQAGPAESVLDSLHVNLPNFSQKKGLEENYSDEAQDFIERDLDILLIQMLDSLRESLHALHKKGLFHNDVALRNCLGATFNGREIKLQLADYGEAILVDQNGYAVTDSKTCPLQWASPDRMLNAQQGFTQLADLHSTKTTFMELLAATLLGARNAKNIMYMKKPTESSIETAGAVIMAKTSATTLNIYFMHLQQELANAGFDISKIEQVLKYFESYLTSNLEDEWVKNGRHFDKAEIDGLLQQDYEHFIKIKEQYIEKKFAALKLQYQQAKQPEDKIKLAPQLMRSLDRLQKITVSDAFKQGPVYEELQALYQIAVQDSKTYIEQTVASLTIQFDKAADKIQFSLQVAPLIRYLYSIDLGTDFQSSDTYQKLRAFYYTTLENCHIDTKNKLASLKEKFVNASDESKPALAAEILNEIQSLKNIKIDLDSQSKKISLKSQSEEFYQDFQQLFYQAMQYSVKGKIESLKAQLDQAKNSDEFAPQIIQEVENLKKTDAGPDFKKTEIYKDLQHLHSEVLKYNEEFIERKLKQLKAGYQRNYSKDPAREVSLIQPWLNYLKDVPVTPEFKQGAVYKALFEFSRQLSTTELKFAAWAQDAVGSQPSSFPVFLPDKKTEVRKYGAEKEPVNYVSLFQERARSIQAAVLKLLQDKGIQLIPEFQKWFSSRMEQYNHKVDEIFSKRSDVQDFETNFDEARRELGQLIVDSYASAQKLGLSFKSRGKFIKAIRQAESELVAEHGWDNIFNQYQIGDATVINAILPISDNPSTARNKKGPFNANSEIIAFKDADNNVEVAQKLWRGSIDPIKIKNRTERETKAYEGLLEIVKAMVKDRLASGQQSPIDLKIAWMSLLTTCAGDNVREIFSEGTSENGQLEVICTAWEQLNKEFKKAKVLEVDDKKVVVTIQAIGMNMPVAKYRTGMQSDIQKEVNSKGLYEYCSFMATLFEQISDSDDPQEKALQGQISESTKIFRNDKLLKAKELIKTAPTTENYNKYQAIRAEIFNNEGKSILNELCKNTYNFIQKLAESDDPAVKQKRKQYEALLDYYEFQRIYYSGDYKNKKYYYEAQKRYVRSLRALDVEVIINCKSSEDCTGKLFVELQVDEVFQRLHGYMPRTMYKYSNQVETHKANLAEYREDVERCSADVVLTGKNVPGAEGIKETTDTRQKKMASLDFEENNVVQEDLNFNQTRNVYQLPLEVQFGQYRGALANCERAFADHLSHYNLEFKSFNTKNVDMKALKKISETLVKNFKIFEEINPFIQKGDLQKISPEQRHELEKLLKKLATQFTNYQQYLFNQIQRYQHEPEFLQALQAVMLSKLQMGLLQGCLKTQEVNLHDVLEGFLNKAAVNTPAPENSRLTETEVKQSGLVIKPEKPTYAAEQAAQGEFVRAGNKHIENWQNKLGRREEKFTTNDKKLISSAISGASVIKKDKDNVHIVPEEKKILGGNLSGFGFDFNLTKKELSYHVNTSEAKDSVAKQHIDAKAMAHQVWQLGFSKIEVTMPKAADKYQGFKQEFLSELGKIAKGKRAIEVIILAEGKRQPSIFVGSNKDKVPAPENNSRLSFIK